MANQSQYSVNHIPAPEPTKESLKAAFRKLNAELQTIGLEMNSNSVKVNTVLTNGTTTVPVYFKADGSQVGLFRAADNKQIWGGKVLSNGESATITNVLYDPDGTNQSWVAFKQTVDGSEIQIVTPSYAGITPRVVGDSPEPVGTIESVRIVSNTTPKWNADANAYVDETLGSVFCNGDMVVGAVGNMSIQGGTAPRLNGKSSQYGQVGFSVGASSAAVIDVSFGRSMLDPYVYLTMVASSSWGAASYFIIYYVVDGSVTSNGFQIRIINNYGSTRSGYINWMAVDSIT